MDRKIKGLMMLFLTFFLAAVFPLTAAAADDEDPNLGEYDEFKFGKEYEPDINLGADDPNAGQIREETDENGNVTRIFLESLMETNYTTPQKEGGVIGIGEKNNDYTKLSSMKLLTRDAGFLANIVGIDPKAEFRTSYTPGSSSEPFKGGTWKGTGIVPLTASIKLEGASNALSDIQTGNYGAYVRLAFSPGVDARSMAKSINWKNSGASSRYILRALNTVPLPFPKLYFPVTWAPRYTRWSEDDPSAIYILIKGVNYSNFSLSERGDMTTRPIVLEGLIATLSGLGDILGHAAGHIDIDVNRYEGNLTRNELIEMNYDPIGNADAFKGADNSPGKVLTKGTLPPDPANKLEWAFYLLDNELMLAPGLAGYGKRLGGIEDAYFDISKLEKNPVENNSIPSWSSYFSPIDKIRDVSDQISSDGLNLDPLKSFNLHSQLDGEGNYLATEFQELDGDDYTMALEGSLYNERNLTLSHKDLLMTYGELNDPSLSEKGGRGNRFMRIVDFFERKDITDDPTKNIVTSQTILDDEGNQQPISALMNYLNVSRPVYFNGTATASVGGETGKINSAILNVLQKFEKPIIKLDDQNSTDLKLRERGQLQGTVSSVESGKVKMYYSLDGGEYQLLSEIDTSNDLGDEKEFEIPNLLYLDVGDIGTHRFSFKAVDEYNQESDIVTQTVNVSANKYKINLKYLNNADEPITEAREIEIDDTDLAVDGTYNLNLQDYEYDKDNWIFKYATLNKESTQYQLADPVSLTLGMLEKNQTNVNYYYAANLPEFTVPNAIDFGEKKTEFKEKNYFPESIDGKLEIKNNTNTTDWALNVESTKIIDSNQSKELNGALSYYKNGAPKNVINESLTIFDANSDGDASSGVTISDDWTLESNLGNVPENKRNGFSIKTAGGSSKGDYKATLNWTFINGIRP
ncbi:hypothetical protein KUA55_02150 [Enterococcus sp. ALS3]|uniref:WxL domain-containing protein n=1 Tax=Enterococcus alishanensis TaxID=1303817 RepID=A0ABS6T995_9ENTE|nr:hypothetical protein [Enterococcus alishanensis]MBV7389466.1 hypothetical protein [Enterococcus alishanensis]